MQKLYVIVRADLAPGAQLAQSNHAVAEFAVAHPEVFRDWAANQRNIVCLNIPNESALADLLRLAELKGVSRVAFREPDFGDELTAIALGDGGDKITSSLPLALRSRKEKAAA
jgi:hypothetical protein